ncbi:MAG: energy transducer TonB [Ferruginibacter sp.]
MLRIILIAGTLVLSTQFSSAQENKTTKTTSPAKTTTSSKTKEQQLKDLKTRKVTMPDGTVVDENQVLIGTSTQEGIKDENIVTPPVFDEKPDTVTATFKGGREAWTAFLIKNINADTLVKSGAPEGRYSVIVQFKVSAEGTLSNFEALTKFGYHAEDEALRVMKLSPKWMPATVNGKQIVSYAKQPITFVVEK